MRLLWSGTVIQFSSPQRRDNDELPGERRSGDDRRSQNRREDRQNVWLIPAPGKIVAASIDGAGDSIHVVSLKNLIAFQAAFWLLEAIAMDLELPRYC